MRNWNHRGTNRALILVFFVVFFLVRCQEGTAPGVRTVPGVRTGLEVLASDRFASLRGKRVGLVTNPTGVDRQLRHGAELLLRAEGVELVALFGPEHGIAGAAAAGAKVNDSDGPFPGVPVYSLYGAARRPTAQMLKNVDVLLYDLQDVGVRTYTYLSTLKGALEAAAEENIELWVLDRPNPLGGTVEGPVLDPRFETFVGPHPIPIRYGMTPGEFARMINSERKIGARLRVVTMTGWRREMHYDDTGLPWVSPSPNIPSLTICLAYPGFVLLEGTNLSEGRGTTRPFLLFGAPWLDASAVAADLNAMGIPGVIFRATEFTPTASKYQNQLCLAVEVHPVDPGIFKPCTAAVAALSIVLRHHGEEFQFRTAAFDRLAGSDELRLALLRGDSAEVITRSWTRSLEEFLARRQKFLFY